MKSNLRVLFASLLMLPALAFAWPWSQDMMNQPSTKPQELPAPNATAPVPFPARSIPTQGIPTKYSKREDTQELKNPIPVSDESIQKGRVLFRIICAACHGLTGKADSPVTDKIGAINLTEEYAQKQLTEGWIFGTITFGGAVMPAYGVTHGNVGSNDLSVEERWHVVNYVRHALVNEPATPTAQQAAAAQP
ncbi:MAG TPA: cytochrome c [Gammaproteobacteria bacterium]|nr:cytochrome c [Gammaproteobacteria bacterium]